MSPVVRIREAAKHKRRKDLGDLIQSLRGSMTQTELGLKLTPNVTQTNVSRWEQGTADMYLEQALELEQILGLPAGALARAGGYVAAEDNQDSIVFLLQNDANLVPELRDVIIRQYLASVDVSSRLDRTQQRSKVRSARG